MQLVGLWNPQEEPQQLGLPSVAEIQTTTLRLGQGFDQKDCHLELLVLQKDSFQEVLHQINCHQRVLELQTMNSQVLGLIRKEREPEKTIHLAQEKGLQML